MTDKITDETREWLKASGALGQVDSPHVKYVTHLLSELRARDAEIERLRDLIMESAPVSWCMLAHTDSDMVEAARDWERRAAEMTSAAKAEKP